MDMTEVAQKAQEALDSTKSAHKRIDTLEGEVKDIRGLTTAMATVNQKVDGLTDDVDEIKTNVKIITSRPGKLWDNLVSGFIGAIAAGVAAAILATILK